MTQVSLRCQCGTVRGRAVDVSPVSGNRVVCHCDDCQAYARFLGRDGIVDARGGTDIFQLTPAQVSITAGADRLRCMRLSEKGLVRWYADCCRTPVGNTTASSRVPFVGIPHCFMDHVTDGRSRDDVLGQPLELLFGRFAIGGPPPNARDKVSVGLILRSLRLLAGAWLRGKNTPSPFFDSSTGAPIARPTVLTADQRNHLRPTVP